MKIHETQNRRELLANVGTASFAAIATGAIGVESLFGIGNSTK